MSTEPNCNLHSVVDLSMKIHAQLVGSGTYFFNETDLPDAVEWLRWRVTDGWKQSWVSAVPFDTCVLSLAVAALGMYEDHLNNGSEQ